MPTSTTFTAEQSARLPGPEWRQTARRAAFNRFTELDALPTEAEEIWRYSRISELDLDGFRPAVAGESGVPDAVQAVLDAIGERSGLIVTRDGFTTVQDVGDSKVMVDDGE